jgi:hypothetical protein
VVRLPEVGELPVVLGLLDVGAVVRVVRAAVVVGAPVAVVSGAEVAVEVGDLVAGTDAVGGGAPAEPGPPWLPVLPAGGGRTCR